MRMTHDFLRLRELFFVYSSYIINVLFILDICLDISSHQHQTNAWVRCT